MSLIGHLERDIGWVCPINRPYFHMLVLDDQRIVLYALYSNQQPPPGKTEG